MTVFLRRPAWCTSTLVSSGHLVPRRTSQPVVGGRLTLTRSSSTSTTFSSHHHTHHVQPLRRHAAQGEFHAEELADEPQILQQIQTQAVTAQRQHSLVRAQIQSKEKERKILDLTVRELATVPKGDTRMFRGVGKM